MAETECGFCVRGGYRLDSGREIRCPFCLGTSYPDPAQPDEDSDAAQR